MARRRRQCDLNEVTLVGHSTGGGEVTRYIWTRSLWQERSISRFPFRGIHASEQCAQDVSAGFAADEARNTLKRDQTLVQRHQDPHPLWLEIRSRPSRATTMNHQKGRPFRPDAP